MVFHIIFAIEFIKVERIFNFIIPIHLIKAQVFI